MSLFMEIETDRKLPVDARKIAELVIETSLDYVKCPYETEVSLLLTTDEEIKEINRMQRQIDRATDVLSFPMADYETPGDFSHLDEDAGLFHPDTGELMLGDIVISVDKVFEQAEEYGHSLLREYAFLIAHSMLHPLLDRISPHRQPAAGAQHRPAGVPAGGRRCRCGRCDR